MTPSGRSRRIKGYQKPGNKIPEKVVVIGDDATNIEDNNTENQELHAPDSDSDSIDEPQAIRTTVNVNVSTKIKQRQIRNIITCYGTKVLLYLVSTYYYNITSISYIQSKKG